MQMIQRQISCRCFDTVTVARLERGDEIHELLTDVVSLQVYDRCRININATKRGNEQLSKEPSTLWLS